MIYQGQTILMASKHQKEKVIEPIFLHHLQAKIVVQDFDTDRLGTFTGEVARPDTALNTCILKAKQAGLEYNYPLILASEGSFGPHPQLPFIPSAHEIMVLVDLRHNWVIKEEEINATTNYLTRIIESTTPLTEILTQVKFPSHAICLQSEDQRHIIAKGIQNLADLEDNLDQGFKQFSKLLLSSDMRAMMNPTRMQNIGKLAEKLAKRILSCCPHCHAPGFGQIGVKGKLVCETCQQPGRWHALELLGCVNCSCQDEQPRADGICRMPTEYCDYCNP